MKCVRQAILAAFVVLSCISHQFVVADEDLYTTGFVPISVVSDAAGKTGTVTLCKLNHALHSKQPDKYPMFRDLVAASKCRGSSKSVALKDFRSAMRQVLDAYAASGTPEKGFPPPVPSGFVFHEARVGSTLVANMLAAPSDHVVYSESTPPINVYLHSRMQPAERNALLQEVVAGMTRVPGFNKVFFKFQSVTSTVLENVMQPFPSVPWVFLYRWPEEVMASMFQTTAHPGKLRGGGPCMRHRADPAPYLAQLLKKSGTSAHSAGSAQFCAAHLANLCHNALTSLDAAQDTAKHSPGMVMDYRLLPGVVPDLVRQHFKVPVSQGDQDKMLDVAKQYSKARSGKPHEFKGDAEAKQKSVPEAVTQWSKEYLYGLYAQLAERTAAVPFLNDEQKSQMKAAAAKATEGAPAAAAKGKGDGGAPAAAAAKGKGDEGAPAAAGAGRELELEAALDDTAAARRHEELAQGAVWLQAWRELKTELRASGALNATAPQRRRRLAAEAGAAAPPGIDADTWPEGFVNPPTGSPGTKVKSTAEGLPPAGYPELFPLVDMLNEWDADDVSIPASYGKHHSVRVFDYKTQLAEATLYREMEVPFVVRGIPSLDAAVEKWTEEYLDSNFGRAEKMVEHSKNNHHMFYVRGAHRHNPSFKPPTEDLYMPFSAWLEKAKSIGSKIRKGEVNNTQVDHYYFRVSSPEYLPGGKMKHKAPRNPMFDNHFIGRDLELFNGVPGFFIVDDHGQKGIHCRFGMEGVVAECHYDAGRNFIALMRGMKRYILAPPTQCDDLGLIKKGPSARHTFVDWGDMAAVKKHMAQGKALEVVVQAGDALYIPAGWFHHIISLTLNYQCNSRSGNPTAGRAELQKCGFSMGRPEPGYEAKHQQRLKEAKEQFAAQG